MQGAALAHRQQLRTIPAQIQASAILGMSLTELQHFIQTEAMENPALSVDEGSRCPVCGFMNADRACPICGTLTKENRDTKQEKLREHDYLERVFAAADPDAAFDPFRSIASATNLRDHLKQQARIALGGRKLRIASYLIDLLDDDGYFRESLFEAAEEFAAAVPEIESVLKIVQGFDPPGIAARDLRECLLIQLRSLRVQSDIASNAEKVLLEHWDEFSKMRFKAVAKKMDVSIAVVREVGEFMRDHLTPRPASGHRDPFGDLAPRKEAAVVPDVIMRANGDSFIAEAADCHSAFLSVDETYDEAYRSIKLGESCLGEEDCKHIREHVERAKSILDALEMRKKTLVRVANHLAEYQKEFLRRGPSHLKTLRQKDVAGELGLHESTICRAIANKFCRLPSGELVSFDMFFDSALPIRNMIGQLIALSTEPLTDGEIAKRLAEQGVKIARRTVAKYREQIKVLPYQLRAA